MAFRNFNAPMSMFGWNGGNHGAGRESGRAAAAGGLPPLQPMQQQQMRPSRGGLLPANIGAIPHPRRRRTRQGRLRSPSSSSPLPEMDESGDALRRSLASEMDDRFSRLKSNQHLAPTIKRTGPVHFQEIPSLLEEREAAEKALVDRYVRILETAVKEGIPDRDLSGSEQEMLHELRMWRDRVKQEKIDNADLRAYLLSRRESLCDVHATLTSALTEVNNARDMVFAPRCPPLHPPPRLPRALLG